VKIATLHGNLLKVTFPYDPWTVSQIKKLPGRMFHATQNAKYWTVPVSRYAIEQLADLGFKLNGIPEDQLPQKILQVVKNKERKELTPIFDIPGLKKKLFPFQAKGVAFLEERNGNALLADEQGLGKTITVLAYLQLHPELRPAVIVTPASLKLNWRNEARSWIQDKNIEVLSGQNPHPIRGSIIIINYDILPHWIDFLLDVEPKIVIADEAHAIKNPKAIRTRMLERLVKDIRPKSRFIALSGTPVINRPIEYFNVINLIDRTLFPSRWKFAQRYCGLRHNGYGWNMDGATNTEELYQILTGNNGIMLRRLKSEVLSELPDKIRSYVPMEVSEKEYKEYIKAKNDLQAWLVENRAKFVGATALTKVTILKRLAALAKLNSACEWIEEQISGGNKLVVFAHHIEIQDKLMERFKKVAVQTVSGNKTKSQEAIRKFQEDPKCLLFVGSLKRDGMGITLTAAFSLAFLELPWTPGELAQAEDRIHRIGQKNAVNIYYLLAENTIDRSIVRILDNKRRVVDLVTDGREPDEQDLITSLIEAIKE